MSINSEITRLSAAKTEMKEAIESKNVPVPADAKLEKYPALIRAIGIDSVKIIKLWENASPNSDFAPQTISGIDVSDAKFFIVVSIIRGNEAHYSACLAENKINQETWINIIWGDVWVARSVTPKAKGLEFGIGKYHNDSAYLSDPTYCKPIRIYKIV